MGVEPFLVTASLNMIQAQRLVRRICKNCKIEYKPSQDLIDALGITDPNAIFYKGQGCERCRQSGYKGRVGLYEVLAISEKMRDAIIQGAPSNQLKRLAIEEGMETLRMAGIRKVLEGATTIEEILSATMADESQSNV